MTREATKSFYDHPRTFMRHNIVLPPKAVLQSHLKNSMFRFALEKCDGTFRILNANMQGAQIWRVTPINPIISEGYRAYWCGYKLDGEAFGEIGNNAEFFFTDTTNGCTLAIGRLGSDRFRKVGHFNASRAGTKAAKERNMYDQNTNNSEIDSNISAENAGRKAQALEQKQMATTAMGNDLQLIKPKNYRSDLGVANYAIEESVTTFGINKKHKEWKFYTLKYTKDGSQGGNAYRHMGLFRQLGNTSVPVTDDDNDN